MLFFSWNKNEATRQEKTAKNKKKKKRRQQGRKKNKEIKNRERERKWQREVKDAKKNERETQKGDTEKWSLITLFSGGETVFFKKTPKTPKNKKGRRPTAQKHTCNAALPPIPRKMRTKEKNTQRKRRGCEEDHLRFSKTGSKKKKKTEKTEKPSAPQRQGHFWQGPEIHETKTAPLCTPRAPNLRAQRTHCEK